MKNAHETISEMIRNRVWMMNQYLKGDNTESDKHEVFNRFDGELRGMLLCLKNIEEGNRFYNLNYYEDHVEYGYYEDDKWITVEG